MVRHGIADETCPGDAAVAAAETVETEAKDETAESEDGWLTGWKLPVLSDVVNKTSSVVQQTVQQTSNVVRCRFCSVMSLTCFNPSTEMCLFVPALSLIHYVLLAVYS